MRVGRTLTHHFEIETRQYDLLGIDLGEGAREAHDHDALDAPPGFGTHGWVSGPRRGCARGQRIWWRVVLRPWKRAWVSADAGAGFTTGARSHRRWCC